MKTNIILGLIILGLGGFIFWDYQDKEIQVDSVRQKYIQKYDSMDRILDSTRLVLDTAKIDNTNLVKQVKYSRNKEYETERRIKEIMSNRIIDVDKQFDFLSKYFEDLENEKRLSENDSIAG